VLPDKKSNFIDIACGENHSLIITNSY